MLDNSFSIEASPRAGLIACCSLPFSPHPLLLSLSLCYTEVIIFPELLLAVVIFDTKARNLELYLNHSLFVLSVSNPLMNVHYQRCCHFQTFINTYIKTKCGKSNSNNGQKWRNTNYFFFTLKIMNFLILLITRKSTGRGAVLRQAMIKSFKCILFT